MSQEKTADIIDLGASRHAQIDEPAHTGALLADARRRSGLTVAEVAAATNVKATHIDSIETMSAADLPATPFAVGFVKAYADFLDLDVAGVSAAFREELEALRPVAEPSPKTEALASAPGDGVRVASILGIFLITVFALWIIMRVVGNSDQRAVGDDGQARPQVTVADERASLPQPRVITAEDYAVEPIPPAASATDAIDEQSTVAALVPVSDDVPANGNDGIDQPAIPTTPRLRPAVQPMAPARFDAPEPVETEGADSPARLVRSYPPDYPAQCEASAKPLETVTVLFDVTAAGRTANHRVLSTTSSCFDDAAVKAIARWEFNPRLFEGAARPQQGLEAALNFRR